MMVYNGSIIRSQTVLMSAIISHLNLFIIFYSHLYTPKINIIYSLNLSSSIKYNRKYITYKLLK